MEHYTICPMTAAIAPAAAALERRALPGEPWSDAAFLAEAANPRARYRVALSPDGEVLGAAGMQGVLGEDSVTTLAVAPEARRRGLGRALMQALIAVCREESALFLTLEVRASNAAAIALYRSLGFAAEGRRPNFYQDPREDALLLTLRFSPAPETEKS